MKKTKRIVSLVLALSMVFGYSGNVIPAFAINSVKNNIVQKATAADNNYRIIAVGDSITYGNSPGATPHVPTPYPAKLELLLDAMDKNGDGAGADNKTNVADFIVTNNGKGNQSMQSSAAYPYINTAEYASTCNNAKDADAIIIMLGTNDANGNWVPKYGKTAEENFSNDAKAMVNRFKLSNPNVRIIFATSPWCLNASTKDTVNNKVAPLQRELAIMNDWELVDINDLTKDWTSAKLPDNIHPNQAAYDELAGFMKNAINDGGTLSSANKVSAVESFITAVAEATAITTEATAKSALTAYNKAQRTFDMLTATEKTAVSQPLKDKLNNVKTKIETLLAAGKVTVTPDAASSTLATTSDTFANDGDKVTITAQKERVDGNTRYVFHKWAVTAGGVQLDDYITETATFTKGATAVTAVPQYKAVSLVKPNTGNIFDTNNRMTLPTGTETKEFEAENMVLQNSAPVGEVAGGGLRAIADRSSSGDLAVTNFNAGDKLEVNLSGAQVGHYTVGITYRSLVTPFPGTGTKPEHGFYISTTDRKLRERYLTLAPTRAGYTNNVVYYTSYFELDVPQVPVGGNATLYLTAETDNDGLVIDKFTVTKQDSYIINAVGDSITFGDTATAYDKVAFQGSYTSYPHLLQHILNNKIASGEITGKDNFIVANLGIPGAAMMKNGKWAFGATDATKEAYAMTTPTYRTSLANKADAVILMLGTNDSSAAAGGNWLTKDGVTPETAFTDSAVSLMRDFTNARKSTGLSDPELFLATSPKTKVTTERPLIASKIVPLQRKIAADNSWNIIDIADKTKDWGASYYADNVHPNLLGYQALAGYMADGFINKVQANNVALGNLFSTATLSPAFNPQVTAYKAETIDSKISLTAVASVNGDKIKIEKGTTTVVAETVNMAENKDITLADGKNVYTITVTAADGKTKVYTVTVTKTDRLAYVSDLTWITDVPGMAQLPNRRDLASPERNASGPLQYNIATTGEREPSKVYSKGVGMQVGTYAAPAHIIVAIPKGATHFDSLAGLDYTRFTAGRSADIEAQVFFGTSATTFDTTANKYSGRLTITPKTTFVDMHVAIPAGKTHMKLVGVTNTTGTQALWNGSLDWADTRFTTTGITDPTAVSEVAVPTITAPVNGEKPASATVEATKNYIAVGTIWKNAAALHFGEFGPSTAYTAEITLKAKPGYKFADTVTVTGDTTPASYTAAVSTDKSTVTLTKAFAVTEATTAKLSALTSTVPFTPTFNADTLAYVATNTMEDNFSVTATPADTTAGAVTVKNGDATIATNTAGQAITAKIPLALGNNAIKVQVVSAGKTTIYTIAVKRIPSTSYISDLPWERDVKGYRENPNQRDKSANETAEPIQLNKNAATPVATEYEKGVGIHAATTDNAGYITVAIPDGAKKFQADVGVAYQRFSPPSASAATAKLTFAVTFGTNADVNAGVTQGFTTASKMVATTPAAGESNTFERINIDIPVGKTYMKLKVTGANSAAVGGGHGNWADAKFISDTTINSVAVNLTPPETGIASADANVDAKENYTHTSTAWKEGATPLVVPAAFGAGKVYDVTVVLTAKAGYKFAADAAAYGYAATISGDTDGNTMTITKTYGMTSADDANLSAFSSSTATVSPAFGANVISYTAATASDKITLTATAAEAAGRVVINNNGAKILENTTGNTTAGDVTLTVGSNVITAVSTNNGVSKTYTLTVTRLADHSYISDLEWLASVSGWDQVTNKKDLAANKDAVEKIQLNTKPTAPFVLKEYTKGVGLHASTTATAGYVVVAIPEGYTRFKADVGVAYQRLAATAASTVSAKAYVYFDTTQAGVVAKTTGADYTSDKSVTAKRTPAATEINTFYPIDIAIPANAKFMKIQAFGTDVSGGHVNFADAQFTTTAATNEIAAVSPVVKAPVTGDTPANATPTSGENYTVTETAWKQGTTAHTTAFAATTAYNVELTLTAAAGYVFATTATAAGFDEVTVAAGGATMTVKKTYPATGAAALTEIASATFAITEPVKNATSSNATVEAAANYTVLSTTWYDADIEINNAIFERNTVYKVVVKLQAKEGFRFANNAGLTVLTGYTVSFDPDSTIMTAEKTFEATAKGDISTVGFTLVAPQTGNTPTLAAPPAAVNYTASTRWLIGDVVKPDGAFAANTAYTAEVTLTADTDYKFLTTIVAPSGYTLQGASIAEGATVLVYKQTFAQTNLPIDKTALTEAIAAANVLKNAATAGNAATNFPQTAIDLYATAITDAQTEASSDRSTVTTVATAVSNLAAATVTFKEAEIPARPYPTAGADGLYSATNRFTLPELNKSARLQAENNELVRLATSPQIAVSDFATQNATITATMDGYNNNYKALTAGKAGEGIKIYYTNAKIGAYKLTLNYRSGATEAAKNGISITGTGITEIASKLLVPTPKSGENVLFARTTIDLVVNAAGDGMITILGVGTPGSPAIDYLDFKYTGVEKSQVLGLLQTAITNATATWNAAPEGDTAGKYPAAARTTYKAAIDAAELVRTTAASTVEQIQAAIQTLATATTTFNDAVIGATVIDKAALITAIANATALKNNATVGANAGNYPQAAVTAFTTAITTATAIKDKTDATQVDVNNAITALATATATFNNAKVPARQVPAAGAQVFTASDRFALPNAGESARLQAENNELIILAAEPSKKIRIESYTSFDQAIRNTMDGYKGNYDVVDWWRQNEGIKVYYSNAKVGTYKVTLNYRSGRPTATKNNLIFAGDGITGQTKTVEPTSTTLNDANSVIFVRTTFDLAVTRAGEGMFTIKGGANDAPVVDYIDFKYVGVQSELKESLTQAIATATAKHTAAVVGTAPGNYTQAAKTAFMAAINAASTANTATATAEELTAAINSLAAATATFNGSMVPLADKTALVAAYRAAQTKHDDAVVGTGVGQYTLANKITYQAAITAAKAVDLDATATEALVAEAIATLARATTAFEATKETVALKAGDINGDNKFDLEDALIALKVATGVIEQPTGNKFTNGNINKVGGGANVIDKADADALLNHIINGTTPTL